MPSPDLKRSREQNLTEVIEETGVTELRNGFLQAIDRLQANPALRFEIRKHGKRKAVLLSAEAFDVANELVQLALREDDALSRRVRQDKAIDRYIQERPPAKNAKQRANPPVSSHSSETGDDSRRLLSQIECMVRELKDNLTQPDEKLRQIEPMQMKME